MHYATEVLFVFIQLWQRRSCASFFGIFYIIIDYCLQDRNTGSIKVFISSGLTAQIACLSALNRRASFVHLCSLMFQMNKGYLFSIYSIRESCISNNNIYGLNFLDLFLYIKMSYNYLFKIVVVGDHNCGKSCILLRFAENTFRTDHISTLGVDFKLKTVKLGRDKIRLELWDTAGMEKYRFVFPFLSKN